MCTIHKLRTKTLPKNGCVHCVMQYLAVSKKKEDKITAQELFTSLEAVVLMIQRTELTLTDPHRTEYE